MHLISCTNAHHDVTDLVNKKILNMCFGWHILRSYNFVVEVTFDNSNLKLAVGQ